MTNSPITGEDALLLVTARGWATHDNWVCTEVMKSLTPSSGFGQGEVPLTDGPIVPYLRALSSICVKQGQGKGRAAREWILAYIFDRLTFCLYHVIPFATVLAAAVKWNFGTACWKSLPSRRNFE